MARYRRYRRTIVRAPKKKWCSNLVALNMNVSNTGASATEAYYIQTVANNKTETTIPTPVIVKTGNFKIQGDLNFQHSGTVDTTAFTTATLYIIYLPEGIIPNDYATMNNVIQNHPEWIMGWRYLESGVMNPNKWTDSNRFSLSTRLKRNLNSGDSIAAVLIMTALPSGGSAQLKGQCQFWTCAN